MLRFLQRILGAAVLLPSVYEEVEADRKALPQALIVVALSSLATGVLYLPNAGALGLLAGLAASLVGWLCWSWLAYHIGVRWLAAKQTEATWGELLRTTGFAAAPGIVRFAGIVATDPFPVMLLTTVWMLVAFVIAVRQALDFEQTWRAVVVCGLGWIIYGGILIVLPQACRLPGP